MCNRVIRILVGQYALVAKSIEKNRRLTFSLSYYLVLMWSSRIMWKKNEPANRRIKAWLTWRAKATSKLLCDAPVQFPRWSILDPRARKWAPRGTVCFCQTKRPHGLYPGRCTNTSSDGEQCPSCMYASVYSTRKFRDSFCICSSRCDLSLMRYKSIGYKSLSIDFRIIIVRNMS